MIIIELNSGLTVYQEMCQSQQLMIVQGDESYDYACFTEEGNEAQRDEVLGEMRWEGDAGQELWSVGSKVCGFRHHHGLVEDLRFQCSLP